MAIHPEVRRAIARFEATELHAARAGREVMQALVAVVSDSHMASIDDLALDLEANLDALLDAMPAYAPPINVMHQLHAQFERARDARQTIEQLREEIAQIAAAYRDWSEQARARIAGHGARLIPRDGTVFTFTLSETALSTLRHARDLGIPFKALVTESRPNNDGLLTARTLAEAGLEVEIGIDASIGEMIPKADVIFVGAEAILSDGSAICKVGTCPAARAARSSGIPVYILVDSLKLHPTSLSGLPLRLDSIPQRDLLIEPAAMKASVRGSLFDRTPAELITAIITERGMLHPSQVLQLMLDMPVSESILARLRAARPSST